MSYWRTFCQDRGYYRSLYYLHLYFYFDIMVHYQQIIVHFSCLNYICYYQNMVNFIVCNLTIFLTTIIIEIRICDRYSIVIDFIYQNFNLALKIIKNFVYRFKISFNYFTYQIIKYFIGNAVYLYDFLRGLGVRMPFCRIHISIFCPGLWLIFHIKFLGNYYFIAIFMYFS